MQILKASTEDGICDKTDDVLGPDPLRTVLAGRGGEDFGGVLPDGEPENRLSHPVGDLTDRPLQERLAAAGGTDAPDYAAGIELGVRGTPTVFVGGARFHGKVTLERLREAVEAVR